MLEPTDSQPGNRFFAHRRRCTCGKDIDAARGVCPHCGRTYDDPWTRSFARVCPLGTYRELILFLFGLVGFQLLGFLLSFIAQAFAQEVLVGAGLTGGSLQQALIDYTRSAAYSSFVNYGAYLLFFVAVLIVIWPDLAYIAKKQFSQWQNYLIGGGMGIVLIVASILWNLIVLSLGGGTSDNQSSVVNIVTYSPILGIVITGIIGPICEEFAYRVGLFDLGLRINRLVAYLFATVVFGLIHMHDFASVNEWLNFPSYLIAGGILAFTYDRFGLSASITAHVVNNLYAVILTLIAQ